MAKGYGEAMALLEFGARLGKEAAMAQKDDKTKAAPKTREPKEKRIDLMALLDEKKREYEAVKLFVEQQARLNKPEEKKKEEKKESPFSERNIALFLVGITPPMWILAYWLLFHH